MPECSRGRANLQHDQHWFRVILFLVPKVSEPRTSDGALRRHGTSILKVRAIGVKKKTGEEARKAKA